MVFKRTTSASVTQTSLDLSVKARWKWGELRKGI